MSITLKSGGSQGFFCQVAPKILERHRLITGLYQVAQGRPNNLVGVEEPSILFLGYVAYEDALGQERATGFLRSWNVETGRFVTVNDPDYEYQD